MSAWVAESGVTLGQVAVDAKSNEIVAIPELPAMLDIQGATVTIDAAGCQRKIAQAIVEKRANYLLSLKDNRPLLHQEVASTFDDELRSGVARKRKRAGWDHEYPFNVLAAAAPAASSV